MEATGLSLGKSVLDGALGYAESAVAEEVALQLGIQQDQAFIRDELEMMMAFLMAAHEERDEHKVIKTWVKQVRDVAYDAEDSLQDFAVRLVKPSWWRFWRIPLMLLERHRVANKMKELRAKVEDVSQRNARYRLIKGPGSKAITSTGQSNMASETMSSTEEVRRQHEKAKLDLIQLINMKDENLRVISVWGTSGVPQETSIIKMAYDDLERKKKFDYYAWIRIMHPFNQTEFVKNIIEQFYVNILDEATKTKQKLTPGAQDLWRIWMMNENDLVDEFKKVLSEKSYLVVLGDLSSMEEWDQIKTCFPNNKNGSRFIVCTEQIKVASLCVGTEIGPPEHKNLSIDQTLYAFYEKVSQGGADSIEEASSSNTTGTTDSKTSMDGKRPTRMETMRAAFTESQLIGREKEKSEIVRKILDRHSQEFKVISIYGMGGLGKTTLVKHVYQSQELNAMFEKRACVTIKRPFNPSELLNSLATQLGGKEGDSDKLAGLLYGKSYLIVLDDISSTTEWDAVVECFPTIAAMSRIIVTTREENIAKHCSKEDRNVYKLKLLGDKDAHDLFTGKVFGTVTYLDEQFPELADEAKMILKKCNGLPLAIVTVGGFLAKQPKTFMEWRKLNEHISAELEMNLELQRIPNVLIKSYDGLPYHLKSCFLYLSIFPEDYNISRRRLVRRWTAEGYTSDVRGKSLEEKADSHFMELIDRSMILPSTKQTGSRKGINSCQLHDLMREICISKSMDENLVFRLEEGSSSSNAGAKIRHVAITSNWGGDKSGFESVVDWSCIRSLTVFAKWRPFFISDRMRLLRVLDLEDTPGLVDHHLENIGRLLHLKYISLRGCDEIYHLPDSWGDLRQLQTLDMKGTRICKLPKAIIELTKLQYLFAGDLSPCYVGSGERLRRNLAKLCGACFAPKLLKDAELMDGDPNRHDVCTFWCHVVFPTLASRRLNPYGVVVPRGVRKLKELRTLGVVGIRGSGKAILRDIRKLTQLRKLAVTGINQKNYEELCSTLADLSRLESLSMESIKESSLRGYLDGVSSPPKNLQSLKLYGTLVKLPHWIGGLQSLVKLVLNGTKLEEVDATMQVLGKLPNLGILRLFRSFNVGEEFHLTFHREAFPNLMVLHLFASNLGSVEFEEALATPRLELMVLVYSISNTSSISGLSSLPSLKEVVIQGYCSEELIGSMRGQISRNPNNPVLKR